MKRFVLVITLIIISLPIVFGQSKPKELSIGDKIPAFKLQDQDNKTFNSANYAGKNSMVIFFYPKDESFVCTKEACSFRDNYAEFQKAGAIVVGINGGSIKSHKSFQQKDNLPYPLLSDANNQVIKSFGVPSKMFMTGRKTFVINKQGKIVFTHDSSFQGTKHAEETLAYLKKAN